jgi:two-component system, OmpR family, KDP operon response regulator KdpE
VTGKVLIVEDDADIARLIGLKLKQQGLKPVFAADAVTAVTIARKEDPDLLVIDIGLPGGGGLLVMERMRAIANLAMKPVIVISAREPIEGERQARELGATAFFPKPLDLDALVEAVGAQLGE